jgi:hypothetical protein
MGSIRFILFAVFIWLVWRMVHNFIAERKSSANKTKKIPSKKMVMCQYCSTHLPENEAFSHRESWFCNQQHKQLFMDGNDKPEEK